MSEIPDHVPTAGRIPEPTLARAPFIKRGDERLGQRYMQRAIDPMRPPEPPPNSCRRERQVASALRRRTDSVIASLIRGGADDGARLCPGAPVRPADGAA